MNAVWKVLPSGSARPELQCENPGVIVIPTQPARYLDPATAIMGMAVSDLPAAVLGAWQNGPAVSGGDLQEISKRFSAISTTRLPVPTKVETETRPLAAAAPSPGLFQDRWEKLGPADHIVGQLSFRYQDSKLLFPWRKGTPRAMRKSATGSASSGSAISRRSRRHRPAGQGGFMSLSRSFRTLLDTAALHSVIPVDPGFLQQLAWVELLESGEMQALRDSGWTIEVDPKAGLASHDATEFFPVIESDPDHGIDWFRFDIAFELQGKQVSLIPIIAQAIRMDLPAADAPDLPEVLPCRVRIPRTASSASPPGGYWKWSIRSAICSMEIPATDPSASTASPPPAWRTGWPSIPPRPPVPSPSSGTISGTSPSSRRPRSPPGFLRICVPISLKVSAGSSSSPPTGFTASSPTTWASGKPSRPSPTSPPSARNRPGCPRWSSHPPPSCLTGRRKREKFTPHLKVVILQGKDRAAGFGGIAAADIVLTSYPLLPGTSRQLVDQRWHVIVLDEAQYIKNPKSFSAQNACELKAAHRLCLSGTPMENHLGELWSLMRFLMPGFLGDEKSFNTTIRRPIERDRSGDAQLALNRRVSPLILRRTKDQVATELPEKTELIHGVELTKKQSDLYESVRAAMDKRVRDAIAAKGLGQSHIIVLDALLKLRQICCHPLLLKTPAAQKVAESAKLDYLTDELLPTLIEEGRRILLFSSFTSMLALIEQHLVKEKIPYLKLTGQTQDRATLVKKFQEGRCARLPHFPQSRRHRAQSHRRRHRHPLRPVVESRRREPGHRPRPPHRPDQARLRPQARLPRHHRGPHPRPPETQIRPRRGASIRRDQQAPHRRGNALAPASSAGVSKIGARNSFQCH